MNRSGMPLASSFDLWNKTYTLLAIFRDQSRVPKSFFRKREERKRGRKEKREERRKKGASARPCAFRPLARRKERFGQPPAERMGPALRPAQRACTSASHSPTGTFRPSASRKQRFGRPPADGAILFEFFESAYYISNSG